MKRVFTDKRTAGPEHSSEAGRASDSRAPGAGGLLICVLFFCCFAGPFSSIAQTVRLSKVQALKIGERIWKNECGGTVNGLTSWNAGENFASLGIGHFIWYPEGGRGPFEESFPKLVAFASGRGAEVPQWALAAPACPWKTRAEFMADFQSDRMRSLRAFLRETVALQAAFCARRLELALPGMLESIAPSQRESIKARFHRVAAEPMGMYALVDYVNFKGEGTSATERYGGHGWGLLQVLQGMAPGPPLREFVKSADRVLTQRVRNAPPARHEEKWLPGWRSRLKTYLE